MHHSPAGLLKHLDLLKDTRHLNQSLMVTIEQLHHISTDSCKHSFALSLSRLRIGYRGLKPSKPLGRCPEIGCDTHLTTRSIWVGQHQPGSNDVKGGVDVHGVWILKGDDVHFVGGFEVTPHPLDSQEVSHL